MPWHKHSKCKDIPDSDVIFFTMVTRRQHVRRVREQICKTCPVRVQCLNEAIRNNEGLRSSMPGGIWAGASPATLRQLTGRTKRGTRLLICAREGCNTQLNPMKAVDAESWYCERHQK